MISALDCFSLEDRRRINDTLDRLISYLTDGEFAIVGGLVIRYCITSRGQDYPARAFNDLDIIIKRPASLRPEVTEQFRISHHHDNSEEFFFAIVDPDTHIKVDIFQWPDAEVDTINVSLGARQLPFQSVENQLAKTIFDTTKVLRGGIVDPKQFSDATLLQPLVDNAKASRIFTQLYGERSPALHSAADALRRAKEVAARHPELVKSKPFHKPGPYQCAECVNDPGFPLTPLTDIHRILGYIE